MDAPLVSKQNDELVQNKQMTRYKKRQRGWDESPKLTDDEMKEKRLCNENGEKIKRKKMAMLLGYCGVDYYGMQRNPGVRTIEEDLLKALLEANYITQDDFHNQQNAQFQRSSRTDKGVSAARQVVSLKIPLDTNVDEINKRLPDCIKVFGVKRVTNKFNSKLKCSARTYSYTLPTYIFDSNVTEEQRTSYRISEEKLEKVNKMFSLYKGTKSYHNFTEKKFYQDPSSSRYMYSFTVDKVFVECGMEFAVLLVKTALRDVRLVVAVSRAARRMRRCKDRRRKMVGLVIAVMRGHTDQETFDRAFTKDKVLIPTAPGLGLVLDMVHYDSYDSKFKHSHETLAWEEYEEVVQKFKSDHIYPNIVKGEVEGNSMGLWLEKLRKHHYEPDENSAEKYDGENDECAVKDDVDDDDYDSCAPVPADDDPVAVQISTNTNKDSEIVDKEDRPHLTERSEEENGNKCSSKLSV
ncbi:tRNA pseudouridine synthase A [Eumeta japonica]|uniref:tRNA pseudouridine synthase A n=1 Tax=Eumeta variegata TaxID=151549 RepID=A0A4C1SR61_EUMVA|nr:tRNA pseudouridine synthase A [Eumeta japonica]